VPQMKPRTNSQTQGKSNTKTNSKNEDTSADLSFKSAAFGRNSRGTAAELQNNSAQPTLYFLALNPFRNGWSRMRGDEHAIK
ncbi:MAG: hypothetical protein ACRD3T_12555, partial [Terriglobia bacterium]